MISQPTVEAVLGAGGSKGPCHLGFLHFVEDARIDVGTITGVSIGAIIAALHANTQSATTTRKLFLREIGRPTSPLIQALKPITSPTAWALGGRLNLRRTFDELVGKYGLKPQPNLRIVAYDILGRKPVVFEGTDYDLGEALAATSALPRLISPIPYGEALLSDGGLYHPYPTEFCRGKAIVAKLGQASKLPLEKLSFTNMVMHFIEMMEARLAKTIDEAQDHHYVDIGMREVAGLTFGLSLKTNLAQVDHGYAAAERQLLPLIEKGLIPIRQPGQNTPPIAVS